MMSFIFSLVANSLAGAANLVGCTYNEINVVLYFAVVPLSWTVLIDLAVHRFYATPVLLGILVVVALLVKDFREFADAVFDASVRFLLWFDCIGWNYTVASVVICVIYPLVIYAALIGWNMATCCLAP